MWRFEDQTGAEWDAVLGRESWGVLVVLLVPAAGGPARQTPLPGSDERVAHATLNALEPPEWQDLLDRSQPKH